MQLLLAGCSDGLKLSDSVSTGPNIILVSIDSLRADHVHSYGYPRETTPFLDSLAAEGVRFANVVSTTSWTLPAHAALFTGLYDATHGVFDLDRSLSPDHLTLAEILKARGYQTAGFYGGPFLHPSFGVAQGFDVYQSCMSPGAGELDRRAVRDQAALEEAPSHSDVTGPRTREAIARWARGKQPGAYFLFVHLWDPHYDYLAPARYARLFTDPAYAGPVDGHLLSNPAIRADMAPADRRHMIGLYDAEIRFTDDVLRGILADLDGLGLLENTLVVVTADHGEEFFEHGRKGHHKSLFDEVLKVPLIFWWPAGIEDARVVEEQVQLVDLAPTLAGLAGHSGPLAMQGVDLAPALAGIAPAPRDALAELRLHGGTLRALRSNERKILKLSDDRQAVYFDLRANPTESYALMRQSISPERIRLSQSEARKLHATVKRAERFGRLLRRQAPGDAERLELAPEMRQRLRALGYLAEAAEEAVLEAGDEGVGPGAAID